MRKLLIMAGMAAALALAADKVAAAQPAFPTLSISGTVEEIKTNYYNKSDTNVQTITSQSFNNASIYLLISNAVAQGYVAGVAATHLPAKGMIVFNPNGSDTLVSGIFFVTNKGTSFSFPLSGVDTNGNYYSYAEFDTHNHNSGVLGFDLGSYAQSFNNVGTGSNDDFNEVESYTDGSPNETAYSTAIFYVHDNPYAYDAADSWAWDYYYGSSTETGPILASPNPTSANYVNALEIQGILLIQSSANSGSGAITGSGNALIKGEQALVLSGKVTVAY